MIQGIESFKEFSIFNVSESHLFKERNNNLKLREKYYFYPKITSKYERDQLEDRQRIRRYYL